MDYRTSDLNMALPTVMFVDINSCFATVEQQANPLLRGKCVAVGAYTTPSGCILAASVEAKRLGVKTGMRVKEGRALCPQLIVLPSDPEKYRQVHLGIKKILLDYSDDLVPKSIDEFALNLENYLALKRRVVTVNTSPASLDAGPPSPNLGEGYMVEVGKEIKKRIKAEVGEWISVSIGIGTSRFWAKTASNLKKPDGLEILEEKNVVEVYQKLKLEDLCGINHRNAARLNGVGIYTVSEFLSASISQLKAAFQSVNAYYWYWRLRGWEIDDVEFERKSFGQSYALPKPLVSEEELMPILAKLTEKMSRRMRQDGFETQGVHLGLLYRDGSYWQRGRKLREAISVTTEIFRQLKRLLAESLRKPVANLAVSVFDLRQKKTSQLVLFSDVVKDERTTAATDRINDVWGEYTIGLARMMNLPQNVVGDRISFGR